VLEKLAQKGLATACLSALKEASISMKLIVNKCCSQVRPRLHFTLTSKTVEATTSRAFVTISSIVISLTTTSFNAENK